MSLHSPECLAKQAEWEARIQEWEQKWPDYCRKCDGRGEHFYAATWEDPGSSDPCDCTYEGICARCGQSGLTSEDRSDDSTGEGPCKNCGWNYDDARPEPWECWGDCRPERML